LNTKQETKYFKLSPDFLLYDWHMNVQEGKILVWVSPPSCTKITIKLGAWFLAWSSDGIYPKGKGMPLYFHSHGDVQKKVFLETYAGGANWVIKAMNDFHLFPEVSFSKETHAIHSPVILLDKNEILVGLASEVYCLAH
jgi:hypothetical protein